jgi:hypothetical protein
MPQAITASDTAREVAIIRAEGSGRTSKLHFLSTDPTFKNWAVGTDMDCFEDLCKYSDKVKPLIAKLTREYVDGKSRGLLRSALGSMQNELRKATKNDKASLVFQKILLDQVDGKPVTRYVVRRTV